MTTPTWWAEHRHRRAALTPLNIAVNARYRACLANGGHTPSGERVTHDFNGILRELDVCANCEVPMKAPNRGYNGSLKRGAM